MNRNDIVRMARKVGMEVTDDGFVSFDVFELKRFAALVAAHEREECAKVCDELEDDAWRLHKGIYPYSKAEQDYGNPTIEGASIGSRNCAAAIRARGQE